MSVHHAFRFSRRSRGINDKERPVCLNGNRGYLSAHRLPEGVVVKRFERRPVSNTCVSEERTLNLANKVMRPAVTAVLDDVVARIAHDNDMLYRMTDICQFTGNGGAQFGNDFRRCIPLALKRQSEFAHHVGAFECNFSRDCVGNLCLEARSDLGG